jgi:hypothetical protein
LDEADAEFGGVHLSILARGTRGARVARRVWGSGPGGWLLGSFRSGAA